MIIDNGYIEDHIISYLDEIRYDTIICKNWRIRDHSGIECTVSLNGVKTYFVHDDDYLDYIDEDYSGYEKYEKLYEMKRVVSADDCYCLHNYSYWSSFWYNDKKNKCMRLWKYSIKNFDDLYLIQNAIRKYLEYKRWKKRWKTDTMSYILLCNKLPLRSVRIISEYHGVYIRRNNRRVIT